jgi:hypothetical protein
VLLLVERVFIDFLGVCGATLADSERECKIRDRTRCSARGSHVRLDFEKAGVFEPSRF